MLSDLSAYLLTLWNAVKHVLYYFMVGCSYFLTNMYNWGFCKMCDKSLLLTKQRDVLREKLHILEVRAVHGFLFLLDDDFYMLHVKNNSQLPSCKQNPHKYLFFMLNVLTL